MLFYRMIEKASFVELWTFVALVVISGLLYYFSNYLKSVILALQLPGPRGVPFIGHAAMVLEDDVLRKRVGNAYTQYGSLIGVWLSIIPFFGICDPNDVQIILSSKKHANKVFFYRILHNFIGNGLITHNGQTWETHRKLIQPSFHITILEKYVATFADAAQMFLQKLDKQENEFNISPLVNQCIVDILNEAILGVPVIKNEHEKMITEESPFRQGKFVALNRISRPWLLFDGIFKLTSAGVEDLDQNRRLKVFTGNMIQIRKKLKERNQIRRKCLLDYMIEINERNPDFTEDDIINEACTFMLAGQDSVGASTAICLFLLAQNQSEQTKCIEELNDIFGDDRDRSPTWNDLKEMRYLEMCIKEALRLYPSVPIVARVTGEDITVAKKTIPSGSNILISAYTTHRIPHIYPDPEKFDPERFTPENCEKRHPYAYLPFVAGPRKCIGDKFAYLEIKTVISRILRNYELLPVEGKTTFKPSFRLTLRASGGLWVKIKPRKKL